MNSFYNIALGMMFTLLVSLVCYLSCETYEGIKTKQEEQSVRHESDIVELREEITYDAERIARVEELVLKHSDLFVYETKLELEKEYSKYKNGEVAMVRKEYLEKIIFRGEDIVESYPHLAFKVAWARTFYQDKFLR